MKLQAAGPKVAWPAEGDAYNLAKLEPDWATIQNIISTSVGKVHTFQENPLLGENDLNKNVNILSMFAAVRRKGIQSSAICWKPVTQFSRLKNAAKCSARVHSSVPYLQLQALHPSLKSCDSCKSLSHV